jgi:hypothetical protein
MIPSVRYREEFPFLNDPDCPPELKILISDRITSYYNYKSANRRIFTATSEEELFKASRDTVENWLENKLIWRELNHYKEKKEILGAHPIFAWMQRSTEIRSMRIGQLVELKENLRINLVKNKKKIRTEKDNPSNGKRVKRVEQMEKEFIEVNRLLNL